MLVGFDQAPSCIGWAYGLPGAVPTRGVQALPNYGENTARLGKHAREWTLQFLKSVAATAVYFEQVIVRRHGLHMPTLHKQFKIVGAIETAADMLGLEDECFEVDISDWRREFYAGARPSKVEDHEANPWKELALKECLRRNWLVEDHNAAEACGIWYYGCLHQDPNFRREHKIAVRRAELERTKAAA